jgi:PAS domain
MLEPAPVSFHLDLYRYWLGKRGSRAMPARRDIDPAEISPLLPYIAIVHKFEGEFRFRLAGSAIARQFGHELTGGVVGSHVSNREETVAALGAICERVFANARPVFSTGQHETEQGVLHNVSLLLLPLSDDGRRVNKTIFTRIACFAFNTRASREWLAGATFKVWETVDVISETDLASRCFDWERNCWASSEPLQRPA